MGRMIFKAKRLHEETGNGRRYHLFDEAHHLLLVGDQGSPWLPDEPQRVRFARPSGEQIATLDLPRPASATTGKTSSPSSSISYTIIYNHAVYAIINQLTVGDNDLPDYLLEVEGDRWLVTRPVTNDVASDHALNIYDQFPADIEIYEDTELPDPTGTVRPSPDSEDYDFTITFYSEALSQPALLALALVFVAEDGAK